MVFTPGRLPASGWGERAPRRRGSLTATVGRPALERAAATRVERIYPAGAVLPENQSRFCVHFSAPMGLAGGAAGNRGVGRPFEVGTSDAPAAGGAAAPARLSFRPAGTTTEQSAASATR